MNTDLFGVESPATAHDVARMTAPQRTERLARLEADAHDALDRAIERHITASGHMLAAVAVLYSGGNDSTTLAHLFRDRADCAIHANTTIGIEKTRQFVRDTCEAWGLTLHEQKPPREADQYRALVLDQGFPGPAHHFKMYQRLKERALREVQRDLVGDPRRERIVFLAGRRRDESRRRAAIPRAERVGSAIWVSPLADWTSADLNTYRLEHPDVPRNEVSDLIHMSGECLCGSFATSDERAEISYWFPDAFDEIEELESLIADRPDIAPSRKTWGWGAHRPGGSTRSGPMCSSCDARQLTIDEGLTA